MKNVDINNIKILDRLENLPGCHSFTSRETFNPGVFDINKKYFKYGIEIGSSGLAICAYSYRSYKRAKECVYSNLFSKRRSFSARQFFEKLGFDPYITPEELSIRLDLLGF